MRYQPNSTSRTGAGPRPPAELSLARVPASPLTRPEPAWRVLAADSGRLLGYVEATDSPAGPRYRADRVRQAGGRLPLGDFAELDDALRSFLAA